MDFVERLVAAQRSKQTVAILGVDPQLDSKTTPGVPPGYTLARFCCEMVEACAPHIAAIKPQLAFFEARGLDGMRALVEVLKLARALGLLTIADAKRGDIGTTSAAYAEAFLGDGDFACDAITVNPYLGSDALAPFVARVRAGRGACSYWSRLRIHRRVSSRTSRHRSARSGRRSPNAFMAGAVISSASKVSRRSAQWLARPTPNMRGGRVT